MIFPHQYFIGFSISLIIGVVLSSISSPLVGLFFIVVASLFLLTSRIPYSLKVLGLVCCTGLLVGGFRYQLIYREFINNLNSIRVGNVYTVEGQVLEEVLVDDRRSTTIVRLEYIDHQPTTSRAQFSGWGDLGINIGDKFIAQVETLPLPDSHNSLIRQQISASLEVIKMDEVVSPPTSFKRSLLNFRNLWAEQIKKALPEPESYLVNGLILGIRHELPDQLRQSLSRSGTTHIIALSGFNITLVILFMVTLLKFLPRRIALVTSGFGILLFIIMTGLASSVVRAASMGWLLLLASIWGRRVHLGSTLSLAGATMVFLNPFVLQYDIGFQLSFLATAGLIFLSPLVSRLLLWIPWRIVSDTLSATLSATIATLPLTTYYFGGISVVGLISNLLIVPLVPFCMAGGVWGFAISWFWPWASPLSVIAYLPSALLIKIVNFWGNLPWSYLHVSSPDPIWPVIFYSGMILIVIYHAYIVENHSRSS